MDTSRSEQRAQRMFINVQSLDHYNNNNNYSNTSNHDFFFFFAFLERQALVSAE